MRRSNEVVSKAGWPKGTAQHSERFIPPETPVSQRIDQVAAYCTGKNHQAEWLKQILEERWMPELPQPFVGFDDDEDAFVLEWHSDTECNTLYINADNHSGTYCRWPDGTSDEPLEELNLDTEEAWLFLQSALTAMTN